MDRFNVLDIPSSLESLERDFNDWSLLPYDIQRKSDDACIEKYGCNNLQLYNILKARLVQNDISSDSNLQEFMIHTKAKLKQAIFTEGFNKASLSDIPGYTQNGMINDRLDKIARSNEALKFEDDWVIICDFIDDRHPDYTVDDLEVKFNRYNSINSEHRRMSDSYSLNIWGRDVPGMYHYMKHKFDTKEAIDNDPEFIPDQMDASLNRYMESVDLQSMDNLEKMIRKLDCINTNHHRSIYESTILESYGDTIKVGDKTYRQDMPGVVPFLTYTEYTRNTKSLDEKKLRNVDPFTYVFNYKESVDSLREMWRKGDKEGLLEAGWNPYIEPTYESMAIARERQIKWFDENKAFDIIDITKFDSVNEAGEPNRPKSLSPIFLVIADEEPNIELYKTLKKYSLFKLIKDYSYVGISTEASLNQIYTFESTGKGEVNRMKIITLEEYKFDKTIHVLTFFVTSKTKRDIKDSLRYYMMNQDNSQYSFQNVVSIMQDDPKSKYHKFNPYIMIGKFLDSVFKISNLYDHIGKQDIGAGLKSKGGRLYVVYSGLARKYKDTAVNKKIDFIKKNADYSDLNFFGPNTTETEYPDPTDYGYYSFDTYINKYQNEAVNELISEIRNVYLNAEAGMFLWESDSPSLATRDDIIDIINKANEYRNTLSTSKEPSIVNSSLDGLKQSYQKLIHIYKNYEDYGLTHDDYESMTNLLSGIAKDIDYNTKYALAYCNYEEKDIPVVQQKIDTDQYKYTSENFIFD